MLVTKRDGRIEEFNVQKIKDIVSFAVNGLGVSSVELESNLQTKFKNKIKTSDIQSELVNTAVSLTSVEEPDWALVAGRLEMYSLLRDIYKNTKYDYNSSLYEIISKMVKDDYYDSVILKEYTKEEIDKISEFIDPSRDWILPISSVKSLRKKYLISSKKAIIELPQVANIVTCMFLNINEPKGVRIKRVEEDYNAVSLLKISLATPFKANLRKPKANLSSCFILEMDDNTESITKALGDIALISKNGGGVGIYLGRIRPSNSFIRNHPGANKINSWAKIINDVIVSFNQGGVRSGAATVSLDIWHKDILDFIEMRTENGGDVRLKCFDIFPQVILYKKFFDELVSDGEFPLLDRKTIMEELKVDPVNLKEINDNYDLIKEKVKEGKLYNCSLIKAKDLWKRILSVYIETGSLYLFHKDNVNRTNPFVESGKYINGANLCCLAGDSMIETDRGLVPIKDIQVNDFVLSYNEKTNQTEYKRVLNSMLTSPEREVIIIEYKGRELTLTPDHRVLTKRGYVEAQDLLESDELIII